MRQSIVPLAALFALSPAFCLAWQEVAGPPSAMELEEAWAIQAREIRTARITLRHVNGLASVQSTWSDVISAFEQLNTDAARGDQRATEKVVKETVERLTGRGPSQWLELSIVIDGDDVRNSFRQGGELKHSLGARRGNILKHMPGFNSAEIKPGPPDEAIYRFNYVRLPLRSVPSGAKISSANGLLMEYEEAGHKFKTVIDRETKICLGSYLAPTAASIRGGLEKFADGVIIPTFGIDIGMGRDQRVRTYKGFLVEDAEFNMPLKLGEIDLAIPAGTRIRDARDPLRPAVGFAHQDGSLEEAADALRRK